MGAFPLHLAVYVRAGLLRRGSRFNVNYVRVGGVLHELLRGYKMSDVIAVLGSLDFVVGEVDR